MKIFTRCMPIQLFLLLARVHQASWERNFHVFYMLLRASEADSDLKSRYHLLDIRDYSYMNKFKNNPAIMSQNKAQSSAPAGVQDAAKAVVSSPNSLHNVHSTLIRHTVTSLCLTPSISTSRAECRSGAMLAGPIRYLQQT